eukprot:gene23281-biopygen20808
MCFRGEPFYQSCWRAGKAGRVRRKGRQGRKERQGRTRRARRAGGGAGEAGRVGWLTKSLRRSNGHQIPGACPQRAARCASASDGRWGHRTVARACPVTPGAPGAG